MSAAFMQDQSENSSDEEDEHLIGVANSLSVPGQAGKGSKPWVPEIGDPAYFEVLMPEEIYDSFFTIRRMGFIANRIIRKLNETKHIVSSKILEKRKKLKALQRKQFEQLSPAGVEYLKVLLKMEIAALKSNNQMTETGMVPTPNVKARLAHLAADLNACQILNKIYATDSNIRTLDSWNVLATDFVNNSSWIPSRVADDRLYDVDPGFAPGETLSAESLRSIFSRMRIDYTKALLKFHNAPKTNLTQEGLDVEFWERYAKHDKALYYIYLLFKGRSGQECLMVDMALSRADHELDQALQSYAHQGVAGMVGMKRDHSLISGGPHMPMGASGEDEMLMMVEGDHISALTGMAMHMPSRMRDDLGEEPAWQATVRKDRAISNYYKRLSINHDVRFYLDLLNKETTAEAMKRNIRNKINTLLLKKVEDRYDDLSF